MDSNLTAFTSGDPANVLLELIGLSLEEIVDILAARNDSLRAVLSANVLSTVCLRRKRKLSRRTMQICIQITVDDIGGDNSYMSTVNRVTFHWKDAEEEPFSFVVKVPSANKQLTNLDSKLTDDARKVRCLS